MATRSRLLVLTVAVLVALPACASGAGGQREIFDTRDLVMEADVPDTGFWYVAEGTAADAVDDVSVEIGPLFDGDAASAPVSGLAPMRVSGSWPQGRESVEVNFRVTSFDTADNAEVRCSVYLNGEVLVERTATGASPVAVCEGEFSLADYLD